MTPAPAAVAAELSDFGAPFHFLAPLGLEAGDPARFDASLLDRLVVEICRVEASSCPVVKTLTSQSSLSERLRLGPTTADPSFYLANWDVSKLKLAPHTYRITVTVAKLELGSLDITQAQYKSFGRTWPIKFRIEDNPTIRVRILRSDGLSASQVANRITIEFGLGPEDVAELLRRDLDPYTEEEIELALKGVFQQAVIPETTKVADQATQSALTAFDPGTGAMTFASNTPVLADLDIGDVLVGEPTAAAPNGYLRTVTGITKAKKGPIVVQTRQASFNEAIKEGTLDAAALLEPEDLDRVEAEVAGVTFHESPTQRSSGTRVAAFAPLDIGDGYSFHETFDITLTGSGSQGAVSGNGTVRIQGELKFNAGYNLGFGVEECFDSPPLFTCVDRFEARLGMDAYSDVKVTGNFEGFLKKETVLSTHYFKPIVFFIGPVPVVLVPIVKAVAGVDGSAHLEFTFDARVESRLEVGAKWTDPDDGGSGWQDINNLTTPTGTGNGALKADMELRAYAKTDAKLLLYGILGPGIAGRLGVGAKVQYPGDPLWKVFGHARGELNFAVDLGGILTLAEHVADLPALDEPELARSANQPPVCGVRTEPVPVELGVETYLGPRGDEPISEGFFSCSDPEGGTVKYSTPTSGGLVDSISGRWDDPGNYDVVITASDPQGLTTQFTLHVYVNNTPPILETATASNSVPASTQYFVTAAAWDVEDKGYVPCTSMTWTVTGGTLTKAGDSRACTVVIVFDQVGSQTVKVVAVDKHNRPSETTLTVNVTAAPSNAAPVIDPSSFELTAAKAPRNVCSFGDPDCDTRYHCLTGEGCRVPYGAILYNGAVGSYRGPLTFGLSASDPNGDSLTVKWFCTAGETAYLVTANADGTSSCDPFTSSFTVPIEIWAEVSDGTTTVRSEVRRLYMLDRVG